MHQQAVIGMLRNLETELRAELEQLRPLLEREEPEQLRTVLTELLGPDEVSRLPLDVETLVEFAIIDTQQFLQERRRASLLEGDMSEGRFALYEDQMRTAVSSLAPALQMKFGAQLLRFPLGPLGPK